MSDNFKLETVRDLLLLDILGGVLVLVILLGPGLSFLRIVLGVPFVLFFPGYFLVSALFPGKEDLDGLERIALSLGLSLALVPLIGLVLNYSPWGIRLYPVTVSLYFFMLSMTGLGWFRRESLFPEERFEIDFSSHVPSWNSMEGEDKLLVVGSVVAVIGAGVGGSLFGPSHHGEEFTEFYVLGKDGKMTDYPTNLEVGEKGTIIVGIKNHEYKPENYQIGIYLDNELLKKVTKIKLEHEDNWENTFTFQVQQPGENKKLELFLYKNENIEPYRKLHLWLTVGNTSG